VLSAMAASSVDLIVTSPPFALLRQKSYGNEDQSAYVEWLAEFGREAHRVLKDSGSLVIDVGGSYERGKPIRSLYPYRVLLHFVDVLGYQLAQDFFWFNSSKLPSPIEWVNKRKIRAKDSVNTVWWFCKSDYPKADVSKVLAPYSERMKTLLKNPTKFYRPKERPSGHDIGAGFGKANGGAIPSTLLQMPNSDSNSHYLRTCKLLGRESHPARFPADLPRFFIKFLTDPGDVVMDIFAGSNTTGSVCEQLERRWVSIEMDRSFAALSAIRFCEGLPPDRASQIVARIEAGESLDLSGLTPRQFDFGSVVE
jgi:site-specific DNA-methyltransferase (cytosine-N4-specific)